MAAVPRLQNPFVRPMLCVCFHNSLAQSGPEELMKRKSLSTSLQLRRLIWVGPITVLASIGAVLLVRAVAVVLLHPDPKFLPLTVAPAILDTTVLVTWAVFVFHRMVSGGALPGRLLALIGARLFT